MAFFNDAVDDECDEVLNAWQWNLLFLEDDDDDINKCMASMTSVIIEAVDDVLVFLLNPAGDNLIDVVFFDVVIIIIIFAQVSFDTDTTCTCTSAPDDDGVDVRRVEGAMILGFKVCVIYRQNYR